LTVHCGIKSYDSKNRIVVTSIGTGFGLLKIEYCNVLISQSLLWS